MLTGAAYADTHNAASCSIAHINAAISAAAAGDTVSVPAGNCTWSTDDCTGGVCVYADKSIKLIGAGQGVTNITDATTKPSAFHLILFSYTDTTSSEARISGFTFSDSVGTAAGRGVRSVNIGESVAGKPTIRLDPLTFDPTVSRSWLMAYSARGLVDSIIMNGKAHGKLSRTDDTAAWIGAIPLGSADAWFLEGSSINASTYYDSIMDCENGARLVARYNTIRLSGSFTGSAFMNHEAQAFGKSRNIKVYVTRPLSGVVNDRADTWD